MGKLVLVLILAVAGAGVYYTQYAPAPPNEQSLVKRAEQGDVISMVILANGYDRGQFGPPDPSEAVKWLNQAVTNGNPEAAYLLGAILAEGRPQIERNQTEGYRLLRLAASKGIPEAFFFLGQMEESGRGTGRDYGQSYYSYETAHRLGLQKAAKEAGRLKGYISEEEANTRESQVVNNLINLERIKDAALSDDLKEIISFRGGVNR